MPRCKIKRYLDYKQIGIRLMQLRRGDESREDVAKGLADRGIDFNGQTLKSYELATEGRYITLENIVALADYYGVSVDFILGRNKNITFPERLSISEDTSHIPKKIILDIGNLFSEKNNSELINIIIGLNVFSAQRVKL